MAMKEMFREKDMTWREFEERCQDLIKGLFPPDKFVTEFQREKTYADGETKRMDIYIAEKRQGGRHYVVDCKHFPKATLNENEIQTTLEYKRKSKASRAVILISAQSNCPDSFISSAERQGVIVQKVSTVNARIVNRLKDRFFKLDLS